MSTSPSRTHHLLWVATLVVLVGFMLQEPGSVAKAVNAEGAGASEAATASSSPSILGLLQPVPKAVLLNPRRRELGRKLFHDGKLSVDGSISCASCHDLERGGADGRPVSLGVNGLLGQINAPTVFNSGFNFRQFWDGRAASLEDQVDGPITHPSEMGSDWQTILANLQSDADYSDLFEAAYGGEISQDTVSDAIATYERSLITPNSPFDRFLRGETDALDAQGLHGYELFLELGCVTCHQGVNIGGNMFQVFGRMQSFFADDEQISYADKGRFNITGREEDLHKFKVPTLRNVALTAPYLHDGSVETLEEVVQIMARHELGMELTSDEVAGLVSFLHALTGEQPETP